MDFRYFLLLLKKRLWLLLLLFVTAAVTTFVLMGRLPRVYKSSAVISTGIVDYKGISVDKENIFVQQFQIENRFNNLIEFIKSRPIMKMMSFEMMLHDFDPQGTPFRQPKESKDFTAAEMDSFKKDFWARKDTIVDLTSPFLNSNLAREIEKSYEIDYESIVGDLDVKRSGETDFVSLTFSSEDPKLSKFILESFLKRFVDYYYSEQNDVETNSVAFYTNLLDQRKQYYDSLKLRLNNYNQHRDIVNLEDQGKAVVTQLRDLELARADEAKALKGFEGSKKYLKTLYKEYNLNTEAPNFFENVYTREDIQQLGEQIQTLNKQYVATGMRDEGIKKQIATLQAQRLEKTKKYATLPRSDRETDGHARAQDYLKQIVELENKEITARESVSSLDAVLGQLRGRKSSLVSDNAFIANLEQEFIQATDDYNSAVDKLNQAKVNLQAKERPLRVSEMPIVALKPESSGKAIFSAFAGVSAVTLSILTIFMMAFFDNSLSSPLQFHKMTNLPLLGTVNNLKGKEIDLNFLFSQNGENKSSAHFKETIRKIRNTIELSGAQVFLFSSSKQKEGKSFLIVSIAYALGLKGKKVLVFDTNFKNNTLTQFGNSTSMNGALPNGLPIRANLHNVQFVGNKQGNFSPSEVLSGINFKEKLAEMRKQYDYIFLEAASLNTYADAHELAEYADKIIPVFSAETGIHAEDQESLTYYRSLNGKMMGAVLNRAELGKVQM